MTRGVVERQATSKTLSGPLSRKPIRPVNLSVDQWYSVVVDRTDTGPLRLLFYFIITCEPACFGCYVLGTMFIIAVSQEDTAAAQQGASLPFLHRSKGS